MARAKEFDPEVALEKAMCLFWEKGYGDTSVRDLVACTGVSYAGLYGTFGNKQGLFSAALERYHHEILEQNLATLRAPDASLPEIVAHFEMLFELAKDKRFQSGCMLCNTAIELAPVDQVIAERVHQIMDRAIAAFRGALARAKDRGEVGSDLDVEGAAELLAATQMSMAVFMRAKWDKKRIERFARHVLRTLR